MIVKSVTQVREEIWIHTNIPLLEGHPKTTLQEKDKWIISSFVRQPKSHVKKSKYNVPTVDSLFRVFVIKWILLGSNSRRGVLDIQPLKHPNMVDSFLDPSSHALVQDKSPFRPLFLDLLLGMNARQPPPYRYLYYTRSTNLLHAHFRDRWIEECRVLLSPSQCTVR